MTTRLTHRRMWLAICVSVLGGLAAVTVRTGAQPQKWPPQFPREGATRLFENEQIISVSFTKAGLGPRGGRSSMAASGQVRRVPRSRSSAST